MSIQQDQKKKKEIPQLKLLSYSEQVFHCHLMQDDSVITQVPLFLSQFNSLDHLPSTFRLPPQAAFEDHKGLPLEKQLEHSYVVIWSARASENPSRFQQQQEAAETPFPT